MSTTPQPASPSSSGDDRNLVPVDENYLAPTFEDRLRLFWSKNSRQVVVVCALIMGLILAKGGYEIYTAQREKGIAADFAVATNDTQLKAFVTSHENHVLGGLAALRLADQAYAAGNYADARATYQQAAGILKNNTFGQRARLGAAISALLSGTATEGESALKQLTTDLALAKMIRAEAAYHLAALAVAAGNAPEALRLIEQVASIDPQGQWAERATMLRVAIPSTAVTTSTPVADKAEKAPTISFK